MSGTIITVLLIIFLLYCFVGIFSIVPYLLGFVSNILFYFIDIIKYNIYPVGDIVYWVISGFFIYLLVDFFVLPFINLKK